MAHAEGGMMHPTLLIVSGLVAALTLDVFIAQVMRYAKSRG